MGDLRKETAKERGTKIRERGSERKIEGGRKRKKNKGLGQSGEIRVWLGTGRIERIKG